MTVESSGGHDGASAVRPERASLVDRLPYWATFAEHAALAARLRLSRSPTVSSAGGGRRRVALLSPLPERSHGTYSRFTQWLPHLTARGWDADLLTSGTSDLFSALDYGDARADWRFYHRSIVDQRRNLRRLASADVVVLHRGLFPFSPWQRPTFEVALARINPHVVYDFFDAIWLPRQTVAQQTSGLARFMNPPDKIERIMRLARVVTVSNEWLAEWARPLHPDVRVLPMLIDVDQYELRVHTKRSPVVLGWIGNRHQIPRLLALAPALRRLSAERDVIVHVVSSEVVELDGVRVHCRTQPWSPETDREDFRGIDIGLLPMAETDYDRGKSPFKLLQYAAAGLPVVATPVAIDDSVLRPGGEFLPARSDEEWFETLRRLVDDPGLREKLGSAARGAVARHYSYEAHADRFVDALRTAAGGD